MQSGLKVVLKLKEDLDCKLKQNVRIVAFANGQTLILNPESNSTSVHNSSCVECSIKL